MKSSCKTVCEVIPRNIIWGFGNELFRSLLIFFFLRHYDLYIRLLSSIFESTFFFDVVHALFEAHLSVELTGLSGRKLVQVGFWCLRISQSRPMRAVVWRFWMEIRSSKKCDVHIVGSYWLFLIALLTPKSSTKACASMSIIKFFNYFFLWFI